MEADTEHVGKLLTGSCLQRYAVLVSNKFGSITCVGPLQAAPIQNLVLPASLARNAACRENRRRMKLAQRPQTHPYP